MGATLGMPHFLALSARVNAKLGKHETAWKYIDDAISMTESTRQRYLEGWILQTAGEIALMPLFPDPVKAEEYFQRGLEFARERCLKGTELCISLSHARLWRDQGKRREAYDLLAPVYDWFTEGFDWKDMIEAKALLEELKNALN